jgi:hypothetical protein
MNDTGWDKLVDAIDVKFGIDNHGRSTEPLEDNLDLTQQIQFIEFTKDGLRYKLARITRPSVIERKSIFHKSAGSGVVHQNIYDPEETSHIVQLYRWGSADWEPIDTDELAA